MTSLQRLRRAPGAALAIATVAMFADSLLFSITVPILPAYLGPGEVAQSALGLLFFSFAAALLVTTPLFAALIDRVGCRAPMLLGLAATAATNVFFALASGLPMLVLARVLQGTAAAATVTAGLALLAGIYPPDRRGKAMGVATAGNAAGTLVGPPLGGFLFEHGGPMAPLLFVAAIAALDGLGRFFLIAPDPRSDRGSPGLRRLARDPRVFEIATVVLLGAAVLTLLEATLPLHMERQFQAEPLTRGLLFAVATIAFGAASPVVGAREERWGGLRASRVGLFGLAVGLLLVGFSPGLVWLFGAMALIGALVSLAITPTMPALARAVDDQGGGSYGLVYGLFNASWAAGMMAGPLVGSVLIDAVGFRAALAWLSLAVLAALLFAAERRRRGVH